MRRMRVENRLGSGMGLEGSKLVGTGRSERVWFVNLAVKRRLLYSVKIVLTFSTSGDGKGCVNRSTRLQRERGSGSRFHFASCTVDQE